MSTIIYAACDTCKTKVPLMTRYLGGIVWGISANDPKTAETVKEYVVWHEGGADDCDGAMQLVIVTEND